MPEVLLKAAEGNEAEDMRYECLTKIANDLSEDTERSEDLKIGNEKSRSRN